MILHLVPYEKMYLSTTMDIDETMAVLGALKECKSQDPAVEKLKQLLDSGLTRAIKYASER